MSIVCQELVSFVSISRFVSPSSILCLTFMNCSISFSSLFRRVAVGMVYKFCASVSLFSCQAWAVCSCRCLGGLFWLGFPLIAVLLLLVIISSFLRRFRVGVWVWAVLVEKDWTLTAAFLPASVSVSNSYSSLYSSHIRGLSFLLFMLSASM